MLQQDRDALAVIKAYYNREPVKIMIAYRDAMKHNHPRFKPRWWKRFLIDLNTYISENV